MVFNNVYCYPVSSGDFCNYLVIHHFGYNTWFQTGFCPWLHIFKKKRQNKNHRLCYRVSVSLHPIFFCIFSKKKNTERILNLSCVGCFGWFPPPPLLGTSNKDVHGLWINIWWWCVGGCQWVLFLFLKPEVQLLWAAYTQPKSGCKSGGFKMVLIYTICNVILSDLSEMSIRLMYF